MSCKRGLVVGLLGVAGWVCAQTGPRSNLWVELRWVDSGLSPAALRGSRDGALVVGTAGTLMPHGAHVLSTQDAAAQAAQTQRLMLQNGSTARLRLSEAVPVQWVDYAVQVDAAGGPAASASAGPAARLLAQPRSTLVERVSAFSVSAHWPGGRQPVQVTVLAQTPGEGAQAQSHIHSTVLLPLGEWRTIARTGAQAQAAEPGVLRSRDAQPRQTRELQLRVELAP
ncbi:hypothetical protein [Roseateles sp. BYS180W]|uniref:hypothetical protein n=1 Tax=Roseateles rivi TaxID=3299028 RepID=UPI0037493F70